MALLEVEDLRTYIDRGRRPVRAVDGVSFEVAAGETLGIVGESGSGKTMTGMSILRLLPPGGHIVGGQVRFEGRDLAGLSPQEMRKVRGSEIGVVFQDPMTSLNPYMSVGNQVAEAVRFHRKASKKEAMERAVEVLHLVRMPKPAQRLGDYPHQLSGGLRQRVMIAMALACGPKLLIADEPTTALDVTIQAQILDLLQHLTKTLDMAMLLITHDMGVIAGRADRVMVMYAGRAVEVADTESLFERTHHPYTEALLASIPQLDQDVSERLYSIPGLPPDLSSPPPGCRFAPRCAHAKADCVESEPPLTGDDLPHRYACFHPRNLSLGPDESRPEPGKVAPRVAVPDVEPQVGGEVILDLQEVSKEFAVTSGTIIRRRTGALIAVSSVSLKLVRGETFGLVGESGCGKTTLGRMAVALEAPTTGNVVFEGKNIASLSGATLRSARRDFQFMFQDPYASLDPRMRVGELVGEPLVVQQLGSKAERQARVEELLDEVGIKPDAVDRFPHEFSGGQRQRIGLARALALSPKLIVADEPVSALDVSIRSQVLNLMKRMQETHGLTYMIISHDLSVVRYLADRVGVMYLGSLVEIGPRDSIFEHAAHPYTAGLLRSIPTPRPSLERAKSGPGVQGELPSPRNPPSGCRFRTRCPLAQERCTEEPPLLRSFGGQHLAACHFPLQAPAEAGESDSKTTAG